MHYARSPRLQPLTSSHFLRILRSDADRLAIACKHADAWVVLSGNQIGTLLGWFIWDHFQRTNAQANKSDVYMIASTVSSKFLKSMAEKEGFQVCLLSLRVLEQIRVSGPHHSTPNVSSPLQFEETLTGFKWMGNKARDLEKEGEHLLCICEQKVELTYGSQLPTLIIAVILPR